MPPLAFAASLQGFRKSALATETPERSCGSLQLLGLRPVLNPTGHEQGQVHRPLHLAC